MIDDGAPFYFRFLLPLLMHKNASISTSRKPMKKCSHQYKDQFTAHSSDSAASSHNACPIVLCFRSLVFFAFANIFVGHRDIQGNGWPCISLQRQDHDCSTNCRHCTHRRIAASSISCHQSKKWQRPGNNGWYPPCRYPSSSLKYMLLKMVGLDVKNMRNSQYYGIDHCSMYYGIRWW